MKRISQYDYIWAEDMVELVKKLNASAEEGWQLCQILIYYGTLYAVIQKEACGENHKESSTI